MLQDQFYMRLMLHMILGIVYIFAYINMAKRNSKEVEPERHLILKIIGSIFAVFGVLLGVFGIYCITQMTYPEQANGPYISPNMIIRSPYETMYWGYATFEQSQCISMIGGFFEGFALSAYCFMFKSSHSKWYTKIGKIVFCILFYGFYASATDFHYFDLYEWTAPVLFAIMAFFAFRNKNQEEVVVDEATGHASEVFELIEPPITTNDDSKYMPSMIEKVSETNENEHNSLTQTELIDSVESQNTAEEETENLNVSDVIEPESEITPTDATAPQEPISRAQHEIKFCRHCGGRIDYQSDKFCKHCGKKLY